MSLLGSRILPEHDTNFIRSVKRASFMVDVSVGEAFSGIGKSIEEAGLRHLKKGYVMAVLRQGEWFFPVSPTQKIHLGDRLIFIGEDVCADELAPIKGLTIEHSQKAFPLHDLEYKMVEATVPQHSSLIGTQLSDVKFRTMFGSIVIAVYRNGNRINQKIGSIRLKAGDMLILVHSMEVMKSQEFTKQLILLKERTTSNKGTFKDWLPVLLFGAMILSVTFGGIPITSAAITTALLLVLMRVTTFDEAISSIKWDILFVIGGAFGIAEAMEKSGAADFLVVYLFSNMELVSPFILLIVVYLITNLMTEIITNNAAALLMFPIVISFVEGMDLNPEPYAVALAIAASSSFSTPIGYQTNLLVYSSGQYRFIDFLKVGVPLNIIGFLTAITVIPIFWPLQ
jgi:di/tricarboxylate transporter